jgi:hypothetical protein
MTTKDDDLDNAYDCKKLERSLTSNFYAILTPPPCQVEEQEHPNTNVKEGKWRIKFRLPPDHPNDNKIAI